MKRLAAITAIAAAGLVVPSTVDAAHSTSRPYCGHSTFYGVLSPTEVAMGRSERHVLVRQRTTSTGAHFHRWQVYRRYYFDQPYFGPQYSYEVYCGELW